MTTALSPLLLQRFFDSNGAPLAGGQLSAYLAGTNTPATTYTDSTGSTPNTNPIILDAAGQANVWLDPSVTYKFVLQSSVSSGSVLQWTVDNVPSPVGPAQIQSAAYIVSAAGGTADAITAAFTPAITALTNGMTLYVRAASANATTTPTFTPSVGVISPKTITKGAGAPLVAGDIAGAGHWIELQYDSTLDKWALQNPATGVTSSGTGFRNRFRNGSFTVNQRGVAGTVTLAAGVYGHDGWKAGAAGCTYTFATSGNSTVITITSGSLLQPVDGPLVEGGIYALSNQGTAQARIAVNGASTSGAYAPATTASPLLSSSATANQQITVEFTTGTLDRVQLEPGTSATVFERRPPAIELLLCQRYYQEIYVTVAGYASAGGQFLSGAFITVPMRAIPTYTLSGGSAGNVASETISQPSTNTFRYGVSSTAAGQCTYTDRKVALTAEL